MQNSLNSLMNNSVKELVAIAASVGAHCRPCLEYHVRAATELGISKEDIEAAVAVGHQVEMGAVSAMKKTSASILGQPEEGACCSGKGCC